MFYFAQELLVAPGFAKNRDVVIGVSGTDALPQTVFYFADSDRGQLVLLVKGREVPGCPDLVQGYIDNNMRDGNRALVAGR